MLLLKATFCEIFKLVTSPAARRWIGCIALCCMVVLVLAFNYLGLLCGTLGYDKHASPTTRGCISNTGGTMLMAWVTGSVSVNILTWRKGVKEWVDTSVCHHDAFRGLASPLTVSACLPVFHSGVGFSFIFSWVLMGVVTALFLAGGNMEKLVCDPFHTKELFKASLFVFSLAVWSLCFPGLLTPVLCDFPGCGHPLSGQPRVEELHPRLHVQWLWPGADSRELLQAKQTHFYVFRWLYLVWHLPEAMLLWLLFFPQPTPLFYLYSRVYIWRQIWKDFSARQGIYSIIGWRIPVWYSFHILFILFWHIMSIDEDANVRGRVVINLEWLISIIFYAIWAAFLQPLSQWLQRLSSSCCFSWVTGRADPHSLYFQIEQPCFNKSWPIKKQAVLIVCTPL